MNKVVVVDILLITLIVLGLCGIVFGAFIGSTGETKTKLVDCYDKYGNTIIDQKCESTYFVSTTLSILMVSIGGMLFLTGWVTKLIIWEGR